MENLNLFLGLLFALFFCGSNAAVQPTLRPRPSTQIKPASDSSACHLPAVTGPCRANFQRYHFDSATGQCHIFTYGGCQGNANNFETLQQCQAFGSRCLRGGHKGGVPPAPLPTRRPMSDHKPLDLRWVGKYPVTTESSGRHHGGGSGRHPGVGAGRHPGVGAGRHPGVGGGRQPGGGSGNRWNS